MMSTNSVKTSWSRLLFSAGIFLLGGGVFLIGVASTITALAMVVLTGFGGLSTTVEPVAGAVVNQSEPNSPTVTYPSVVPYGQPAPYDNGGQPAPLSPADVVPAPAKMVSQPLEPVSGTPSPENSVSPESP